MKKYLILSLVSVSLSVIIVIQLYKNTDFELVDAIVESTVSGLGIKSEMVEKKIERKIEEKKVEEEKLASSQIVPKIEIEIPEIELDSAVEEEPEKKVEEFNTKVAGTTKKTTIKVDSANFNMISTETQEEEVEEEPVFNVYKSTSNTAVVDETPKQFFTAKIHNTQTIINEKLIWVRSDESVSIDGIQLDRNSVFQARANIVQGRLILSVENINGHAVKISNWDSGKKKGMTLAERHKVANEIVLSDGESVTFNYY
ncbi:MAG: conjugative transposon protein TraM [Cyclobacteriaceae bacterium]